jgi:predicted AAA+ superfamily ATPase
MMAKRYLDILDRWNFWHQKLDTGIFRKRYWQKLLDLASTEEVVAVCGVRRGGKSTILRQLIWELHQQKQVPLANTLHVNFEDPRFEKEDLDATDLFALYKEYQQSLKPKGRVYFFLDEVQKVTRWEKFVRTLYDLKENVKFYVTGSNSLVFASKLSTVLTGRMVRLTVAPLSFAEFKDFGGQNIDQYLRLGGFPRVVLEEDEGNKNDVLVSYYQDILENDVILRNSLKNKTKVKRLTLYLLSNAGNLVSTYALAKLLKLTDAEVGKYLDFLEEAYLISRTPLFSYSVKKQIYNPDKVFCVDTGLANTAGFAFSENKGRLLENLVFNHLVANKKQVYYWKNKETEIDFVVQEGLDPAELINVTTTVDDEEVLQRELRSLEIGQKEFPKAKTTLLTLYNQSKQSDPRIKGLEEVLLGGIKN